MQPITKQYANVRSWRENHGLPPLLLKWAGLSPDTLEMSSNRSQVWGIPCFGKSIDLQWHLFRHSISYWK